MRLMAILVLLALLAPTAAAFDETADEEATETTDDGSCVNMNGAKIRVHYDTCTRLLREVIETETIS